jgi:hypothetical protein
MQYRKAPCKSVEGRGEVRKIAEDRKNMGEEKVAPHGLWAFVLARRSMLSILTRDTAHQHVNKRAFGTAVAQFFEEEVCAVLGSDESSMLVIDNVGVEAFGAVRADDVLRRDHLRPPGRARHVNKQRQSSWKPFIRFNSLNVDFMRCRQLLGVNIGAVKALVAAAVEEVVAELEAETAVWSGLVEVLDKK